MIKQVEGNIYTIPVPLPKNPLRNLNAYVIKDPERSLLIDTGFNCPECEAALLGGLSELGVDRDRLDIFLTHLHADHTGLAPVVMGRDTKIFVSEPDREMLLTIPQRMRDTSIYMCQGFSPEELVNLPESPSWKYVPPPYDGYIGLRDGETLSYGGRKLRVVYTPGHTPGHACLYDAENAVIFLGDHILYDITPNITCWQNFPDPLGAYSHSLVETSLLHVRLALPAHRSVEGNMYDRIGDILEHHAKRIQIIEKLLSETPGMTAYELASKMPWRVHGDKPGWENFPNSQKWFAVGEAAAHLEYLVARRRVLEKADGTVNRYYPA